MIDIPYFQEDKSLLIANDLLQNTDFKSDFISGEYLSDGSQMIHITKPGLFFCNYSFNSGSSFQIQNDLDYRIGCLVILASYGLGYFVPTPAEIGFCSILPGKTNSRSITPSSINYNYYVIILAIEMDTQYLEN